MRSTKEQIAHSMLDLFGFLVTIVKIKCEANSSQRMMEYLVGKCLVKVTYISCMYMLYNCRESGSIFYLVLEISMLNLSRYVRLNCMQPTMEILLFVCVFIKKMVISISMCNCPFVLQWSISIKQCMDTRDNCYEALKAKVCSLDLSVDEIDKVCVLSTLLALKLLTNNFKK